MATTLDADGQAFSKKLEAFSGTLSARERSVFAEMLQRPEITDKDLQHVTGGAGAAGPQLGSNFFAARIALCW